MLYYIYKDGILIKEDMTAREVAAWTGININSVNSNMRRKAVTRSGYTITRSMAIVSPQKKSYFIEDAKLIDEWNNMMAAADMIRKGTGRLVCHGGKKYVKLIK